MRRITKAGLTLAATVGLVTALVAAAGPALAYPPPSVHLLCSAGANNSTLEGGVCVLPFGVTTPPNSYSAAIAVSNPGAGDTTPDNGGFLISGTCVLPDANVGVPYQGHLPTSHKAGGMVSVVSGSLPPGLSLPATFGASGDVISGAPGQPGIEPAYSFIVKGTGDQGQPLYQSYQIMVDPNEPLAVVLPSEGSTLGAGTVGQAYAQDFFLSGGAAPYSWAVSAGQLPPGLSLQSTAGPRDADNELAGTPTTAGTYTFTMRVTDYNGQQATQQFTLTIQP